MENVMALAWLSVGTSRLLTYCSMEVCTMRPALGAWCAQVQTYGIFAAP